MQNLHNFIDMIASAFVPIHREGHKFVAITALATLLLFLLWPPLGWLVALKTLFVGYFFRDPERVTPLREGLIISPADGRITTIETLAPPIEMGLGEEPRQRISIFLSIFDVHINRAPIAGRIVKSVYTPGLFLNAAVDKASDDNERQSIVIESHSEETIGVVQIAGFIARRIVMMSREGDLLGVGERYGLIRFGSRVDVFLPPGKVAHVTVNQTVLGGETVLADLKSEEGEREARQS